MSEKQPILTNKVIREAQEVVRSVGVDAAAYYTMLWDWHAAHERMRQEAIEEAFKDAGEPPLDPMELHHWYMFHARKHLLHERLAEINRMFSPERFWELLNGFRSSHQD